MPGLISGLEYLIAKNWFNFNVQLIFSDLKFNESDSFTERRGYVWGRKNPQEGTVFINIEG